MTIIWIMFAIQVHGDHYHSLQLQTFPTEIACRIAIPDKVPNYVGVGCIPVRIPGA